MDVQVPGEARDVVNDEVQRQRQRDEVVEEKPSEDEHEERSGDELSASLFGPAVRAAAARGRGDRVRERERSEGELEDKPGHGTPPRRPPRLLVRTRDDVVPAVGYH